MRPLSEWKQKDLQDLINGEVPESLTLEFKSAAALSDSARLDISKFIAAFANSAGGRLIYGIVEDKSTRKAVAIDGVQDPKFSREWLDQVIHSTVNPRVQGVIIQPISVTGFGDAFVIDVPPAVSDGPHQADDRCYYKRRNFTVSRMEDYEIRDVMRRATTPNLRPGARVFRTKFDHNSELLHVSLQVTIRNLSNQPAFYSVLRVFVDDRLSFFFDPNGS